MWKPTIDEIIEESVPKIGHEISESTLEIFNRAWELVYNDNNPWGEVSRRKRSEIYRDITSNEEIVDLRMMFEILQKKHDKQKVYLIDSKKRVSIWNRLEREEYNGDISDQNYAVSACINFIAELFSLAIKMRKRNDQYSLAHQSMSSFDLDAELIKITGLNNVKSYLKGVQAQLRMHAERSKLGLSTVSPVNHMIFQGNPGTGKTTIARIFGDILFEMGVLKEKNFVETDRSGLVAEYVGQTAIKTQGKIQEALDGVLFIDEAYSLASDAESGGFGKEAIDTLVKGMEDNRHRLIVILAGYKEEMQSFLKVNPGLQSRFSDIIDFPDYTVEELTEIAIDLFEKNDYSLTSGAIAKMKIVFTTAVAAEHFGNGRYIRNFFEETIRNQAVRLHTIESSMITKDILTEITEGDISGKL